VQAVFGVAVRISAELDFRVVAIRVQEVCLEMMKTSAMGSLRVSRVSENSTIAVGSSAVSELLAVSAVSCMVVVGASEVWKGWY
jgi:hypothetical protein